MRPTETRSMILFQGFLQIAIDLGCISVYPKWFGSLESNHPDSMAIAVLFIATLTIPLQLFTSLQTNTKMYSFHEIILSIGSIACGIPSFYGIIVLFGAPLFQLWWKTFLLATLMSVLAITPLSISIGIDITQWIDIVLNARFRNFNDIYAAFSCIGSLSGAYLGTIFIPLDWDRPWQQWPLPCIYGCIYGHVIGITLSMVITALNFKIIKRNE